jgi:hypothetical protein
MDTRGAGGVADRKLRSSEGSSPAAARRVISPTQSTEKIAICASSAAIARSSAVSASSGRM